MWYTEGIGKIASLTTAGGNTEYGLAASYPPSDIVLGGDGTPWVLDMPAGDIMHRNSAGQIVTYNLNTSGCCSPPNQPDQMAYAPNGNIWFLLGGWSAPIGEVTPSGVVSYVPIPASNYNPSAITVGTDGSVWLTNNAYIMHLSSTGALLGTYNYAAPYIMTGSDGNIWFTQTDAVGSLNAKTGVITVYPIYAPVPGCNSYGCSRGIGTMTLGPDGAYWFVEKQIGYIGRIDTAGNFSEYQIYAAHVNPFDITAGPDGNVWFVDSGAQKIGKVNLSAL
jgi:virginiamycin B lyase